ncbi:hypothetical protein OFN70_07465 [Campylobacter sp. CN_NE3]|uniref:hypothetical protein n=1 Tax=Campylobacter sp. CN_NE3 TaxID=2984149 RepID=UPI0022E9F2D4|nr:hypothetical protein [Campylobacter sp. CN_NE3]MDA3069362.1 hypothetical protein [Campylobacter sp. CN_NE3]
MPYFNPKPLVFNPDSKVIEASGAIGQSLFEIMKENTKREQENARLAEAKRANLQSEAMKEKQFDFDNTKFDYAKQKDERDFNWDTQKWKTQFEADQAHRKNQQSLGWANYNLAKQKAEWDLKEKQLQAELARQEALKKSQIDTLGLNAKINLINQNDPEIAKMIGIDNQSIESVKANLKEQGATDEQINEYLPKYLNAQIGALGSNYLNNPIAQNDLHQARADKLNEIEASKYAGLEMVKNSTSAQDKLSQKYGVDIKAMLNSKNPQDIEAVNKIIQTETKPSGSLSKTNMNITRNQAKIIGDNIADFHLLANIANTIGDGAKDFTGWFGLRSPANSIAKFINSDDMRATMVRSQMDAYNARIAKSAKSNRQLDFLENNLINYGDKSTNNLLSNLVVGANMAYETIRGQLKSSPNGVYSDEQMSQIQNLEKQAKILREVTGYDPFTLQPIKKTEQTQEYLKEQWDKTQTAPQQQINIDIPNLDLAQYVTKPQQAKDLSQFLTK